MTLRPMRGRHREKLSLSFRVYTRDRQKWTPRKNDSREHVTAVRVDAHRILLFFMFFSLFSLAHISIYFYTSRFTAPRFPIELFQVATYKTLYLPPFIS